MRAVGFYGKFSIYIVADDDDWNVLISLLIWALGHFGYGKLKLIFRIPFCVLLIHEKQIK